MSRLASYPFVCLFFTCLLLSQSCGPEVITDYASDSNYLIDNQTSHPLYFNLMEPQIDIPIGETVEIFGSSAFGPHSIPPDRIFEEIMNGPMEVYLYRDSLGVEIEALLLNPEIPLAWQEEIQGPFDESNIWHFTLRVTDEMIE